MNSKYWAFICHHQHDVGTWGGAWKKKEYDLKEFKTEEELDKYIEDVPNSADYDYSIELLYTSYDNSEEEIGAGDD